MGRIISEVVQLLEQVRDKVPLIHNITNYVTVNDVANAILAIGASPIMADAIEEAADITAVSSALVLNIGTLNGRTVESMISAGKKANSLGIPVIFDPVGAGASCLRSDVTRTILESVKISILRGNLSEISFTAGLSASTKGVDVSKEDEKHDIVSVARKAAAQWDCIAAVTGAVDVIAGPGRLVKIRNGNKMLSRVTGTGCMTTALVGAFAGAGQDPFAAAAGGVASMGIAGELAFEAAGKTGTGSYHIAIIDALSCLDGKLFAGRIKLDEETD